LRLGVKNFRLRCAQLEKRWTYQGCLEAQDKLKRGACMDQGKVGYSTGIPEEN